MRRSERRKKRLVTGKGGERGENLHWLVFRAIYREKPEKGLRVRDWKELSDAEVDRRFETRHSRKRESLSRELLKWPALVAKVQIHEENLGGRDGEREKLDSEG